MLRGKVWVAVLVAPLAQLLVLVASFPVFLAFDETTSGEVFRSLVILAVFALPIAYGATILVGLPVHFHLLKKGLSEVRTHTVIGLVVGAVAGFLLLFKILDSAFGWIYLSMFVASGGVVAMAFGYLATSSEAAEDAI